MGKRRRMVRAGDVDMSLRHWMGNTKADQLAKEGAAQHQLSQTVIRRVEQHSHMAQLFLRRMARVIEGAIEAGEAEEKLPRLPPVPRWKRRKAVLTRAILQSGHRLERRALTRSKVRYVCGRCLAVRRPGRGLLAWLKATKCRGMADPTRRPIAACPNAHHSHNLDLVGEVVICRRCGCYAGFGGGIRDLRRPCGIKPSARAKENFRQIDLGKHPKDGRPMGQASVETLLGLDCLAV